MAYQDEDPGSELEQQQAMLEQQQQELAQQENVDQQEKLRIEEKILKNKIKFICMNLSVGSRTKLKETEKNTIKKAKKFPGLKADIKKVTLLLNANRGKVAMKTMASSPAFYYVAIGALILLLIICAVAAIGQIMPWLFPEDESGGQVSSAFGITGKDFYGGRMVYKNDELAATSIVEDYVEFVENGIVEAKTISIPNATLEINIPLPEEYDYSTFDEAEFQTTYSVLYSTIFDMAKAVYKVDNSTDFVGASLIECVNGILYFGYGETAIADVSKIAIDAIINNKTITASGENSVNEADINSQITSKLTSLYGQEKFKIRTEKLFVKDYILEGEDDMMKNISKENYVAFIFMPKTNVTFTKFSFSVGNANLTEFTISLTNNGSEITLKKDDADYNTSDDPNKHTFIYISNKNLNVDASAFGDIDTNNIDALSEGLSLFDVVEKLNHYSTYLEITTNENSLQYWTIKKNGVVASLSNTEAFNFVEFETKWE